MLREFGFEDFKLYLATRPEEKSVGDDKMWAEATVALEESVKRANIAYDMDEGGGAFYGPKIDIKIKDALGREWQCSTIQFDFNLPERFDMTYVGSDGQKHRPYMIHRALLGSLERFIGILIEHYAGKFPLWLSPVQVILASVGDEQANYVNRLEQSLMASDIQVETDVRSESVSYKIRDAVGQKVPYVGVIGPKEMEENTISIRKRGENKPYAMNMDEFISALKTEIEQRR